MGFSEKLYDLRKKNGLSQKKLAHLLEVSQASINYWEKGQRIPSINMVTKIANFFSVPVDYLIDSEYVEKQEKRIDNLLDQSRVLSAVGDVFDLDAEMMLSAYSLLNKNGKTEACKRVTELVEIHKYRKDPDEPAQK